MDPISASRGRSGSIPYLVFTRGLWTALSVGLVDVAIGLVHQHRSAHSLFHSILVPLALVVCLSFAAYVVTAAPGLALLGRAGMDRRGLATALAGAAVLFYTLVFLPQPISELRDPGTVMTLRLVLSALLTLFVALRLYVVTARNGGPRAVTAIRWLGAALPLALALFVVHRFAQPSSLLKLLLAVLLVVLLVTAWFKPRALTTASLLLAPVVLAAPLVYPYYRNAPPPEAGTAPPGTPRNVILLVVDTLRADQLSCYGAEHHQTPQFDRLAADGVRFESAIAPSPWTIPSMASIMTGLAPQVHGATAGQDLRSALPTLAEVMSENSYLTAAFGYNSFLAPSPGFAQGFAEHRLLRACTVTPGGYVSKRLLPRLYTGRYATTDITDSVIDWIARNREQPFMLWVHYYDPHSPYRPPRRFLPEGQGVASVGNHFWHVGEVRNGKMKLSEAERRWVQELYSAEVRYVDDEVGRLLQFLEAEQMYDDSLIVLASDHGEEFWEHGGFAHGHALHRELLKVPLIVKPPGGASGVSVARPVDISSVMPTILDICGLSHDGPPFSASSLVPAWNSGEAFESDGVVSSALLYYEDGQSVTTEQLKYIELFYSDRWQLFDLSQDPLEQHPLPNDVTESVLEMRGLLGAHHERSAALRDHYGLEASQQEGVDAETMERLRAIGYLK